MKKPVRRISKEEKNVQRVLGLLPTWAIRLPQRYHDQDEIDYFHVKAVSVEDAVEEAVEQMPELVGQTLTVFQTRQGNNGGYGIRPDLWGKRITVVAGIE